MAAPKLKIHCWVLLLIALILIALCIVVCCNLTACSKPTSIVLRVFADFSSSESSHSTFLRMRPDSRTKSKVAFTTKDDYTHCVILNTAMPTLKIPKQNVIGMAHEPVFYLQLSSEFVTYAKQHIGAYYIGENTFGPPFVAKSAFLWHAEVPMQLKPKTATMSIIFSDKKETTGQLYRHQLVAKILQDNLPIDIWGRGCEILDSESPYIMGPFSADEPYEKYQYTIAIENCASSHYVSEKFINALIFETVPLYWGASCVETENPDQFIRLFGEIDRDMRIITDVLRQPQSFSKVVNRFKVAEQFDLIRHLEDTFCSV